MFYIMLHFGGKERFKKGLNEDGIVIAFLCWWFGQYFRYKSQNMGENTDCTLDPYLNTIDIFCILILIPGITPYLNEIC